MAKLIGSEFKFTWSGTTPNVIFTTRGHIVAASFVMPMVNTTVEQAVPGTDAQAFTAGLVTGQVVSEEIVETDDAQPMVPVGTSATWTIYPKSTTTTKNWTGTGIVERVDYRASAEGSSKQIVRHTIRITGTLTRTTP